MKVIALFLFILFLVMQIWFGQKSKIIAYFFFVISASLYIMDFNISTFLQVIILVVVLSIVLGSLYFETKTKNAIAEEEKNGKKNQQTFANKNRRK